MIRWRGLYCTPRRRVRASHRIRPDVEPVGVLFSVQHRQHSPAIGIAWRLLDGPLQAGPGRGVFFGGEAREVREAAENRFVWGQLFRIPIAEGLTHVARQNAIGVGDSGDDRGDEIVLQREDLSWAKSTIISFGPKVGTRTRIDELHRNAQPGPRLA